jgi:hypothetical protein
MDSGAEIERGWAGSTKHPHPPNFATLVFVDLSPGKIRGRGNRTRRDVLFGGEGRDDATGPLLPSLGW